MKTCENIRFYRTERGLSQRKMCEITGITRNMYSRAELGKIYITDDMLHKISDALDVDMSRLRGDEKQGEKEQVVKEPPKKKKSDLEDFKRNLAEITEFIGNLNSECEQAVECEQFIDRITEKAEKANKEFGELLTNYREAKREKLLEL